MTTLTTVCIAGMMLVPALSALAVVRFTERPPSVRRALGLVLPRPLGRLLRSSLLAIAVPLALQLVTLLVAVTAGTYHTDLADFSGFRAHYAADIAGGHGVPVARIAAWAALSLLASLPWMVMFFGEEIGWQGFLFPRLRPLGTWAAMLLTAAAFALWHTPTLLLGGQYPGHSALASVLAMLISAVLIVPIFCWLRVVSGSVLGPVLAHTFVSSFGVDLIWLFSDAHHPIDPLRVGLNGWPGWIVLGCFVAALAAIGQLRKITTAGGPPPPAAYTPATPEGHPVQPGVAEPVDSPTPVVRQTAARAVRSPEEQAEDGPQARR